MSNQQKIQKVKELITNFQQELQKLKIQYGGVEKLTEMFKSSTKSRKEDFEKLSKQKKEIKENMSKYRKSIKLSNELIELLSDKGKITEEFQGKEAGQITVLPGDEVIILEVENQWAKVKLISTHNSLQGAIPLNIINITPQNPFDSIKFQLNLDKIYLLTDPDYVSPIQDFENVINFKKAKCLFDYNSDQVDYLSIKENEILSIVDEDSYGWTRAINSAGKEGFVPTDYIEIIQENQENQEIKFFAINTWESHDENTLSMFLGESFVKIKDEDDENILVKNNQGKIGTVPSSFIEQITPQIMNKQKIELGITTNDYYSKKDNELSIPSGNFVIILEKPQNDFWMIQFKGKSALFPSNKIQFLQEIILENISEQKKSDSNLFGLVIENYVAQAPDEISIEKDSKIEIIEQKENGWWIVSYNQKQGLFPSTYIEIIENQIENENQINENQIQIENNENQIEINKIQIQIENVPLVQNIKLDPSLPQNENELREQIKKFQEENIKFNQEIQKIQNNLSSKPQENEKLLEKLSNLEKEEKTIEIEEKILSQINESTKTLESKADEIQKLQKTEKEQQENQIKEIQNLEKLLENIEKEIQEKQTQKSEPEPQEQEGKIKRVLSGGANREDVYLLGKITKLETENEKLKKILNNINQDPQSKTNKNVYKGYEKTVSNILENPDSVIREKTQILSSENRSLTKEYNELENESNLLKQEINNLEIEKRELQNRISSPSRSSPSRISPIRKVPSRGSPIRKVPSRTSLQRNNSTNSPSKTSPSKNSPSRNPQSRNSQIKKIPSRIIQKEPRYSNQKPTITKQNSKNVQFPSPIKKK